MIDLEMIAPRAEIVGADGIHVGTVDHVDGSLLALNHCDSDDGRIRNISGEMISAVEDGIVHLTSTPKRSSRSNGPTPDTAPEHGRINRNRHKPLVPIENFKQRSLLGPTFDRRGARERRMHNDLNRKKLKVLVVDDELFVRMMAVDVIRDAGYETLDAVDADEALALLEEQPDIDVVFTDIRMPGSMDGLGLARTLRTRWPAIRVLLTSGHVTGPEMGDDDTFLPKPYRASALAERLHAIVQ